MHPKQIKYDRYVYECENDLYMCITYRDFYRLQENQKTLREAHNRLVNIVKEYNWRVHKENNVLPSERKCGALDVKCKSEVNRGMGQ